MRYSVSKRWADFMARLGNHTVAQHRPHPQLLLSAGLRPLPVYKNTTEMLSCSFGISHVCLLVYTTTDLASVSLGFMVCWMRKTDFMIVRMIQMSLTEQNNVLSKYRRLQHMPAGLVGQIMCGAEPLLLCWSSSAPLQPAGYTLQVPVHFSSRQRFIQHRFAVKGLCVCWLASLKSFSWSD